MAKTHKGHIQRLPRWPVPSRNRRYARRVGIASSVEELRHYSAAQLLAAGTD